jgi:hypothetical protein
MISSLIAEAPISLRHSESTTATQKNNTPKLLVKQKSNHHINASGSNNTAKLHFSGVVLSHTTSSTFCPPRRQQGAHCGKASPWQGKGSFCLDPTVSQRTKGQWACALWTLANLPRVFGLHARLRGANKLSAVRDDAGARSGRERRRGQGEISLPFACECHFTVTLARHKSLLLFIGQGGVEARQLAVKLHCHGL